LRHLGQNAPGHRRLEAQTHRLDFRKLRHGGSMAETRARRKPHAAVWQRMSTGIAWPSRRVATRIKPDQIRRDRLLQVSQLCVVAVALAPGFGYLHPR
jgi:hypothetical protein